MSPARFAARTLASSTLMISLGSATSLRARCNPAWLRLRMAVRGWVNSCAIPEGHLANRVDPHRMRETRLMRVKARPLPGLPCRPSLALDERRQEHTERRPHRAERNRRWGQDFTQRRAPGEAHAQGLRPASKHFLECKGRGGPD